MSLLSVLQYFIFVGLLFLLSAAVALSAEELAHPVRDACTWPDGNVHPARDASTWPDGNVPAHVHPERDGSTWPDGNVPARAHPVRDASTWPGGLFECTGKAVKRNSGL